MLKKLSRDQERRFPKEVQLVRKFYFRESSNELRSKNNDRNAYSSMYNSNPYMNTPLISDNGGDKKEAKI